MIGIFLFISKQCFILLIPCQNCTVHNDSRMTCKTPNTRSSAFRRKRAALGEATFGFIIADVLDLKSWSEDNNVTMEYFPDPEYFPFTEDPLPKKGMVQIIEVSR